jgi:Uncharacterized homolog of the cytoplasmic domain of flagellar protein FhlB
MDKKDQKMDNSPQIRTAVALSYDPKDNAPKIVASGHGYLADKIVSVAKDSEVPVHKDEKLANTLSKLEIGEYIPPELYEVVAEILVFVDNMDRIKSKVLPDDEY